MYITRGCWIMVSIIETIKAINPKAEVSVGENDVKKIQWYNDTHS